MNDSHIDFTVFLSLIFQSCVSVDESLQSNCHGFSLTAYWRFWLCVTVVYELFLIFILFQVGNDMRILFLCCVGPFP